MNELQRARARKVRQPKLAEHIVETKTGDFEPDEFVDRYENAVVDLLKQKQAGQTDQQEGCGRTSAHGVQHHRSLEEEYGAGGQAWEGQDEGTAASARHAEGCEEEGEGLVVKDQVTALQLRSIPTSCTVRRHTSS